MLQSRELWIALILITAVTPLAFLLMPIIVAAVVIGGLFLLFTRWRKKLDVKH